MRRTPVPHRRLLALLGALTALLVPVAIAGADTGEVGSSPDVTAGQMTQDMIGAWFVQLSGNPTADGGNATALTAKRQKFHADAKNAGIPYKTRYEFQKLWNGVSIEVGAGQLEKVLALPNVQAIYPVHTVSIPETTLASIPDLATAIKMTGADIAQNELGLTGEGVKVAVMDTGIDLDHPDLGGDGSAGAPFPNSRVVSQWDFVGDDYNAEPADTTYSPTPVPDPVADDCNGHGTHVSGIVGAKGEVTGVAPGVTFGAYRVFGCDGSTTDEVMIAAMERALDDDMDVLNMSIGDAFNNWHQAPTGQASTNLVKKGMVVVASIGNSGANGVYSGGVPGMGDKVIGVASYDNSHVSLNTFTVSPDDTPIGYGNAAAAPPAPTSGTLPLDKTGTPTTNGDGCINPPAPGSMTGKAVLIRRGSPPAPAPTCSFFQKALAAQNAGAAAVILYNNVPGRFSPTVAGPTPITIPVVAISDTEGVLIDGRIAAGPTTMTWTDDQGSFTNPTGGLISSFSSYGLEAELDLKPDIGAPGGLIRSTYPLEGGAYATISGTSMASPHVAGAAALLLQAKPNTNPGSVRTIFQNSADPAPWFGNPSLGFLDNVHRQGAGMVDIDDSILAETEVSPSKLALGESESGPAARQLEIWNRSKNAVTYDLSYVNALSTGGSTFAPTFNTSNASVAFSSPSVNVPAQSKVTFTATITPSTGPAKGVYGGYIVLTPQGGAGQTYRVPFAGFIGDYQSIVAATPTAAGLPDVARLTTCNPVLVRGLQCFDPAGTYTKATGSGATFSMTDAFNVPQLRVHLDHQVRRMKVEVRQATTGRSWHLAFDLEHLARNSGSTNFFVFPFSGQTTGANGTTSFTVPDGTYVFRITIVKAGGSSSNPAHTETLTTTQFTIDRP
jgi:minor extracellular serine protease Vpr